MAGHVPKRVLKKPQVDDVLLKGTMIWKWDEGDQNNIHRLNFFADESAFYLYARMDDKAKEPLVWNFSCISDVRPGKAPRDSKVSEILCTLASCDSQQLEDYCLTLVYRRDGMVNLDYVHLMCEWPEVRDKWMQAVNRLTFNMLNQHCPLSEIYDKNFCRIRLCANGYGEIPIKAIKKVMMMQRARPELDMDTFLASYNLVKKMEDGTPFVHEKDFNRALYDKIVQQSLKYRENDVDFILNRIGGRCVRIQQITVGEFHNFLKEQRDPRLNDILHVPPTKEQARALAEKFEGKRIDIGGKMPARALMKYLESEENNVLNLSHLDEDMDMTHSLSHYFINSSHNTYLTGHQLKSLSTVEMYIQCLLNGCRCLELDCWPNDDDICITHGNTLCTKIPFKDVLEAINTYAFVTSEYPLILSIENHCKTRPNLIQRMATYFTIIFGDKLLKEPFEDLPLESGFSLPSLERLKGKILLKDKIKRMKGGGGDFGTLPRGSYTTPLDGIPEEGFNQSFQSVSSINGRVFSPKTSMASLSDQTTVSSIATTHTSASSISQLQRDAKEPDRVCSEDSSSSNREAVDLGKGGDQENVVFSDGEGSDSDKKDTPIKRDASGSSLESEKQRHKPLVSSRSTEDYSSIGSPMEDMSMHMGGLPMGARPSEVEPLIGGPLAELLNYCTGITFEGFESAEKLNCSFYQSSFVEDKGENHIRSSSKEFVKYNIRQMSRIYPQGNRIASSNYNPQIYWNVGCQLVALNFQTSDLPMQMNTAKFEFNGLTGCILKPKVMLAERSGSGAFNPFNRSQLENIVPAKLTIEIISGLFLTEKKTGCYVETEMYGLPSDTLRHKFTSRKDAPHPFWNHEPIVFNKILLPEIAMLRVAAFDEDKELLGQRFLPVNAIRPGYRHIPLRDKHNVPLPLSTLFVFIKVEDYVQSGMEDIIASLIDPISFAKEALAALSQGCEEDTDSVDGAVKGKDSGPPSAEKPKPKPLKDSKQPVKQVQLTSSPSSSFNGGTFPPKAMTLPPDMNKDGLFFSSPGSSGAGTMPVFPTTEDTLPTLEKVKTREWKVTRHDDKEVLEHSSYLKVVKKCTQEKYKTLKRHEKSMKFVETKKGVDEDARKECVSNQSQKNQIEIFKMDKKYLSDRQQVHNSLLEALHTKQLKELEKQHKQEVKTVNSEILASIKVAGQVRQLDDRIIQFGSRMRGELEKLQDSEMRKMKDQHMQIRDELSTIYEKEILEIERELFALQATSGEL